ncbi:MAG: tetratricopeptide repeat protein [Pseudomonadota bacterium]
MLLCTAALCCFGALPARADARADCQRLTAPVLAIERVDPGYEVEELAEGTLEICAEAARQAPDDPRLALFHGLALLGNDRPQDALIPLMASAEAGDSSAAFFIALIYASSDVEGAGPEQALEWYEKAAEMGHMGAQAFLGFYYDQGIGAGANDEQATFWLEKAAAQGHAGSMYILGLRYADGEGAPKDEAKGLALIEQAASLGVPQATYSLGYAYLTGDQFVEQDVPRGLALLEEAAGLGSELAMVELGRVYLDGELATRDETKGKDWFCLADRYGAGMHQELYGEVLVCE